MKILLAVLLAGNLGLYAAWTRPAMRQTELLQDTAQELRRSILAREKRQQRLEALQRIVEGERTLWSETLESGTGEEELHGLARFRDELLAAAADLPLRRGAFQFRLAAEKAPPGYQSSQVRLEQRGDFFSLFAYLDRLYRLKTPFRISDVSLAGDTSQMGVIVLTIDGVAFWAERTQQ